MSYTRTCNPATVIHLLARTWNTAILETEVHEFDTRWGNPA